MRAWLIGVRVAAPLLFLGLGAAACEQAPGGGDQDMGVPDMAPPVDSPFGLDARPANPSCVAPERPPSAAPVTVDRVYSNVNLGTPMMLAQRPGDPSRWFVAQRGGTIVSFASTSPGNTPDAVVNLATLSGAPVNTSGEGGLLGFAFHPRFSQTGKLYVTFTTNGMDVTHRSQVGVLTSNDQGASFSTYAPILGFEQTTATNHKGGGIAFDRDGYLYLSFGDGGGGDDQFKNGQKTTGFFSKILRIDIDDTGGQAYGIPADNPFAQGGGEPATFAWGFRNPFRFSIDRETNEVWVGDVGQNQWEEIDRVRLGGNYGWPCREGLHDYITNDATKCPNNSGHIDPVVEHRHVPANSRSITGGVVYRGKAMPALVGSYIYGDFETQELFILSFDPSTGAATSTKIDGAPAAPWVHFAEDNDGEVYPVAINGQMYKINPAQPSGPSNFPERLSATGCTAAGDATKPAAGLIPYGVNSELWSDGAVKERYLAVPDGETIAVGADGDFDLPIGSVLVKTFTVAGQRVETRLLVRHDDGGWAGYSYEWLADGSDAVLLPSGKTKSVGGQSWTFPSRSDCVRCHTEAAGRTLGLELGQLDGDFVYTSTNRRSNQVATLAHIGLFTTAPPATPAIYPTPTGTAPLEQRARSYLHANCSHCHRPNGGGRGNMDLRFATPFSGTATCNVDPEAGSLGIVGAKLLVPGNPDQSIISIRAHALGANRMPPLASSVVDTAGVMVVDDWIRGLTGCP